MMSDKFMLLNVSADRPPLLLRVPADYSDRDALRQATALVAKAQQEGLEGREALEELLEDRGFISIEYIIGPTAA